MEITSLVKHIFVTININKFVWSMPGSKIEYFKLNNELPFMTYITES